MIDQHVPTPHWTITHSEYKQNTLLGYAEALKNDFRCTIDKSITDFCSTSSNSENRDSLMLEGIFRIEELSEKMNMAVENIDVNRLPRNSFVRLKPGFLLELFKRIPTPLKEVAKKLQVSYSYLCQLKRDMYALPLPVILNISRMLSLDQQILQKNIISIGTRSGHHISNQLPLKPNKEIASLIGHVFGDGYIGRMKRQFEYSNKNPHLIKEVKKIIKSYFNLDPITEKIDRITYPVIIGALLKMWGAPLAPKINSKDMIPSWIQTNREYKVQFLRAFFDDDGSIIVSKNYRAAGVNLYIIRRYEQKKEAIELVKQIKNILKEFEVYSGDPKISKTYAKKDGKRIIVYINITDYESIKNFHQKIALTDGKKNNKLKSIVATKRYSRKANNRKLNICMISLLKHKKKLSTAQIASNIKITKQATLKRLKKLKKIGIITKVGKVAINRSFIWKFKEES